MTKELPENQNIEHIMRSNLFSFDQILKNIHLNELNLNLKSFQEYLKQDRPIQITHFQRIQLLYEDHRYF